MFHLINLIFLDLFCTLCGVFTAGNVQSADLMETGRSGAPVKIKVLKLSCVQYTQNKGDLGEINRH